MKGVSLKCRAQWSPHALPAAVPWPVARRWPRPRSRFRQPRRWARRSPSRSRATRSRAISSPSFPRARPRAATGATSTSRTRSASSSCPNEPGDYEVRLLAADSPYKTLLAKPIKITGVSATVKGAGTRWPRAARSPSTWTGPNNERDYVGIGEPNGRPYLDYKYTRERQPDEARGSRKARHLRGALFPRRRRQDHRAPDLHRHRRQRHAERARAGGGRREIPGEVDRPEQRARFRDHREGRHGRSGPTRATCTRARARRSSSRHPKPPGNTRSGTLTGKEYNTLARAPLTVGSVSASVTAPRQVAAGAKFQVSWTGPNNPRDFVTLVKAGARGEDLRALRVHRRRATRSTLTAPDVAGRVRAALRHRQGYLTLARAPVTVTAITGTLTGPATVVAGETFKVTLERPGQSAQLHHHRAEGRARRRIRRLVLLHDAANNPVQPRRAARGRRLRAALFDGREIPDAGARARSRSTPAKSEPGKVAVTLAEGHSGRRRRRDHPRRLRQHAAEARRAAAHRHREADADQAHLLHHSRRHAVRVARVRPRSGFLPDGSRRPGGPAEPGRRRPAHQCAGREERREDADRRVARKGARTI